MTGYFKAMRRYGGFSGRASRAEYWGFYAVLVVLFIAAGVLDRTLQTPVLDSDWGLLVAIVHVVHIFPQIATLVRRLHDTDHSGWWFWIALTGVGLIVLLVFACLRGTRGPNHFGPSPYGELNNPAHSPATGQAAMPRDVIAEIERLADLKTKGGLSDAEFEVMKAKALSRRD